MNRALDKISKLLKSKASSPKTNSILHNNIVLYVVFVIAIVNFFSYLMVGDVRHTIIFLLTGLVTSFVSKNMVVILCISMAVTNIVKVAMTGKEGMEGSEEEEEEKEKEGMENKEEETTEKEVDSEKEKDTSSKEGEKSESMKTIKNDGSELIKIQDKIIDGFKEIEPYMEKAENLTDKINRAADKINMKQINP